MRKVLEASEAVAQAVKLCRPDVIPMYPITPQTHMVERLADYINDGEMDALMIDTESEHSAISACIGAQAAGSRTFTATASQGLALMHEVLFIASGMRMPIVMAVANRTLSAPINIWNDQQDSISSRDSGWIQLYVESGQEALDSTIMAYKIAEKVLLPVMICLDGFTLTHVFEPVDIPAQQKVDGFLPTYKPRYFLDPKKPITMGPIGFPDSFMHFKEQQQEAMTEALSIISIANTEFQTRFGRSYGNGLIETYRTEDAKQAIVAMGTACGTAKVAIDELRKKGKKIGLIKIKSYRPFPRNEIIKATKKMNAIAVIDRDISLGFEGALLTDVRSTLQKSKIIINGYVMGLGGKDITIQDIKKLAGQLEKQRTTQWMQ
ncbi:MAG: transketolase C-terminal domain-containing protein [Candidatus Woesearchaeota archaeon]